MNGKLIRKIAAVVLGPLLFVALAANSCSNEIDDWMRALGQESGTFYNFSKDGQVVFEAHCRSIDFTRDTEYDRHNSEGDVVEESSVVLVTCGPHQFSTVGFTSVYISDKAQSRLFADPTKFYNTRVSNNDFAVPLVNIIWRSITQEFSGAARVATVSNQWNDPILAFAASHVTGHSTEIGKSTMFKLDDGVGAGYVWIYRGSYTVIDTALLNNAAF